ncbi:MAG: DUF1848 domain-containing protein [Acidobacteriota bacterium]|nr:DUF1848 domain-containing protein [Acidobacteriota bacterium]
MIISASRRTDIPACRADWFMDRIRAGFCDVASPFDRSRVSRVSLAPGDVDVIVFWTRDPSPLMGFLDELDRLGYRYYFQYTLLDYPRALEPGAPNPETVISGFRRLADRIGAAKVVWRYDPILIAPALGPDFHRERFERLAAALAGATERVVISLYDEYPFTRARLRRLEAAGLSPIEPSLEAAGALIRFLAAAAEAKGMTMVSCAEKLDLRPFGVRPGRCIDPVLIQKLFGIEVPRRKDPGQRPLCGCAPSRDIGAYDTCGRGCLYCYATRTRIGPSGSPPGGRPAISP